MQKIISLFQRNYDGNRQIRNEVTPGAEWVLSGEGIATQKWEGTCCMIKNGQYYKRHEVKNGNMPPDGFIPAQEPDPITGDCPGWIKIGNGPEDKYFREAYDPFNPLSMKLDDGTYELVGPKINGNKENFIKHILIMHGVDEFIDNPRTFDDIKAFLNSEKVEGIVWHHPDGRMAKIKAKDFGIKR